MSTARRMTGHAKHARDIAEGDVLLLGMMPRRVVSVSQSYRTGLVTLLLRTEWGSEYHETFSSADALPVLP